MKALCEVFAYGCYVQGFYNADPHPGAYPCMYAHIDRVFCPRSLVLRSHIRTQTPTNHTPKPNRHTLKKNTGNIFVQTLTDPQTGERHVRPVVLDWGMAKTLPEHVRVGNAKIVRFFSLSIWDIYIVYIYILCIVVVMCVPLLPF